MVKVSLLAAATCFLLGGAVRPAMAQFPLDGTPGGPAKMQQARVNEQKKETIFATLEEGLMERALHRMGAKERKELNEALVERGSLVLEDGTVIEKNKDPGEQIIDPRTPKGFGNPFFRAIHVEQNIKVNNLLTEFEQKELARLKWQQNQDLKENATEELNVGTGWTPFIAMGEMKTSATRGPEFMAMMEVSPHKIIRRVCESCEDDFKDIYYKRLTNDYQRSLFTMLKNGPFDSIDYEGTKNQCWVDFTLHSTYEDAVAGTNPWQHCHPDPNKFSVGRDVGFPSYSGPEKHDANNINKGTNGVADYAFYYESSNWIPTAGTWRLDIAGSRDGVDIEQNHISKISEYLDLSPNRIARWVCNDCIGVYQDVYFKHIAPAGISVNNVEHFLLQSFQPFGVPNFEFRQDFNIYSTYQDAIAGTNAWEYCEWLPENTYGFPAGCRPKKDDTQIPNQWVRVSVKGGSILNDFRAGIGAQHTCLYVEDALETPDREKWMSIDDEMELFFYGKQNELPTCLAEPQAQLNTLGNAGMAKHGTAVVGQKYHSGAWYGNPAETYKGARDFCMSKGMDLCPLEKTCPVFNGVPDGGVRYGDVWVPYLDEDNGWVQVGTWMQPAGDNSHTCKTHEDSHGVKPDWGLYGEAAWGGPIPHNDIVHCCAIADQYQYDDFAGYYDVRGCGECHDECFWMGVGGTTYSPTFEAGSNPWHTPIAYDTLGNVTGFFTCKLSGSSSGEQSTGLNFLKDDRGITTFPHRKCAGKAQPAPRFRADEYMGCYGTGYPSALPELIGDGQPITHSKCSDACAARNYHYFGRSGNGECRCGGRTKDDYTFERFGLIPYGASDYCKCDDDNIGSGMCTYRVVDQFDPTTARKHHPCRYTPAYDMRKQCYISCRDADQSMANKLMCNMFKTMGMKYLSKKINRHNDLGGQQLHMLGGDGGESTAIGTF